MTIPVLTAAAVRSAEAAHPRELADGTLMQRAAMAVATECIALLHEHGRAVGRHVLLLVGPGDNGGDALFVGAMLARRGVAVYALPVADRMHDAGAHALQRAGGRVVDAATALQRLGRFDLVVDGIVGLASTRPLDGVAAHVATAIAEAGITTLAIDVPSGVHVDTGAVAGVAIRADVTVTFGALRRAHVIAPGALRCGDVHVADIGVAMEGPDHAVTGTEHWFAPPEPDADKYRRGVVGVVTGSAQYPGAALLSVGAALRSGCGMVRYFGEAGHAVVLTHPEVVPAAADQVRDAKCQAWLVGCGMATTDTAAAVFSDVLARPEPLVVDADAITLLAQQPHLRSALQNRTAASVLTPHAGELRRLADALGIACDLDGDRLAAAMSVASALHAIVLLKGPTTLITDGTHFVATPPLGAQLATAGSGDVLAGLLAGALARWSAAEVLAADAVMELAAAAAVRHATAALPTDTIASDLVIGLDAP